MAGSRRTEYEIAVQVAGSVEGSFNKSVSHVNDGFESMANMARMATDNVNNGFEGMADMARSAAKMAVAALASVQAGRFIGDAVETYAEFEQSMANTAAIANATEQEYEMLEKAALEMGKATTKTATEASDALGYMMLAGWSVGDSISGLEPVLRLSEATQMDLARCSDLVTDSMSALGLSADGLSGYLDICTAANNNANTTAEALMEAFIGCGGAAKTVKANLNDMATALGILANNGTKGAQAGTAMNSMLVRMTSKDVAINAMKELGVAVFNDAGEFRGLKNVLVEVQEALSGLTTEEQAAYMSKIAGTNYYTEMSYLLDAVKLSATEMAETAEDADGAWERLAETADGNASVWDALSQNLNESEGALMNMAGTVTDTLQGAFSRLDSAVDDAKINFAGAFSGELKGAVNDLAGYIPTLTQKFIDLSAKAGPKISRAFASVRKGAGEVWDVLSGVGKMAIEHFDALQVAFMGIGGAFATYKIIDYIGGMAKAIKGLSFGPMSPLLALTLVSSAVMGIVSAVKAAERQAAQNNLARHFGDIALSMEDVSKTAEYIVSSDNLSKIHESLAAFGELSGIESSMRKSVDAVNKMNWKLSIGMELSADEKGSYVSEIQNYVSQAQSYVEQQQYALNVNLALFSEGDLERQNIVDQLNDFYADKYAELEKLGRDLNETVTAAFEDGLLDMDEVQEITDLQAQMARIQEAIATSDFEARLKVMELQYSGKDLDAESFKALQEELATQVKAAASEYEESLQLRIANYQVMLDDGEVDQAQYDAAVNEFWKDYMDSVTTLETKSLEFQTNTIMQQYGDEVEAFYGNLSSVMKEYAGRNWEESGGMSLMDEMVPRVMDDGIGKDTKEAIEELLDPMEEAIKRVGELRDQCRELGAEFPEELQETLEKIDLLSAMTAQGGFWGTSQKDTQSVMKAVKQQIVNRDDYEEIERALREYGWDLPEAFAEELETARVERMVPAINDMYASSQEYIDEVFAQGLRASADVRVALNPAYSALPERRSKFQESVPSAQPSNMMSNLAKHAEGGIFDTPHVAWFAEEGPEAAIPLDGSSNAISLWERVGRLLGVLDGGMGSGTSENNRCEMATYQSRDSGSADDTADARFVFAPQVTINGSASREDVESVLTDKMEEFREMMERFMAEKNRVSFG
ncbi:phage tail tape measure protein [bacterium D16-50]|nr:phage tail tape measure protein [bacterium D16-50]